MKELAGYRGAPLFAAPALDAIYAASSGTPRLINVLCHKALLAAFGPGAHQVVARHARAAIEDTNPDGSRVFWLRPALYGSAFVAIAAGVYLLARWVAGVAA